MQRPKGVFKSTDTWQIRTGVQTLFDCIICTISTSLVIKDADLHMDLGSDVGRLATLHEALHRGCKSIIFTLTCHEHMEFYGAHSLDGQSRYTETQ